MKEIENKLQLLKTQLDQKQGSANTLNVQLNSNIVRLNEIKEQRELFKKCVEVLSLLQDSTKEQVKQEIETLVTYGLQSIMGDGYKFEIIFDRRGNLSDVKFRIITPSNTDPEPEGIEDEESGFILDVIAVCLRIILCEFFKDRTGDFIILDEPFKGISEQKLEATMNFLKEISKKLNRQIIIVSHQKYFYNSCDNGIDLEKLKLKGENNE